MKETTSVPMSVPCLVLDKVGLLSVSESIVQCSYSRKVPNKSLSHELRVKQCFYLQLLYGQTDVVYFVKCLTLFYLQ